MLFARTISAADKIGTAGADRQIVVERIAVWSSADGNVVLSDGVRSITLYVNSGFNGECCMGLPFEPGASVTFTPSAPMTVIAEYTQK